MGLFNLAAFKDLFVDKSSASAQSADNDTPVVTGGLNGDKVLIAYATQAGAAEMFAQDTAKVLQQHGIDYQLEEFYDLDLALLEKTSQALFIVSTTYDGEPPDMAEDFCDQAMHSPAHLAHLHYALMSLGDRAYDEFCGFGHRLDNWLRDSHATPFFALTEIDDEANDDVATWNLRLEQLIHHAPTP